MNIDLIGYREWAQELADQVVAHFSRMHDRPTVHFHGSTADTCATPDLIYLVGWSEIVPVEYFRERTVLVLHPSALPLYRGGSPIQHQIIDGLDVSAVSLFRLDELHPQVDSGPLAWQQSYSLDGTLSEVLGRIATVGAAGVISTITAHQRGMLAFVEQLQFPADVMETRTRRRRKPEESEITLESMGNMTARQVHDFVRALQEPYPTAFIRMPDESLLYLLRTRYEEP